MPLVVPGLTTTPPNKTEEWQNKLVGKTLSDTEHNEVELPAAHRVIRPGQMVTRDFDENRLSVYLAEDGTVSHVQHG
ncbi:hypothetical protein E4U41_004800 [Claviceps citrina]|nr:hypothetical protein E4U41_004800 [Claviceps citrina]